MKRPPMTKKGAERLRIELDRLKSQDRPRIISAIAEARAHGDLKENAEYHAAREMQGFIEGRIQELDFALSHAEVIDVTRLNAGTRIVFGATVDLSDEDSGEEISYQIVGDLEADIKLRLISVSSPFARALIGKSAGDSFEFRAPNGTRNYEITGVRYETEA
jgi:transcription elongation factor GreA